MLLDDEDVRRLHVAVDHVLLREVLERLQHLSHEQPHLREGQWALSLDEVVQRAAGAILHGVAVDGAHVHLPVVEHDVVVVQPVDDRHLVPDVAEHGSGSRADVLRGVVAVDREKTLAVVGGVHVEFQEYFRPLGGFAGVELGVRYGEERDVQRVAAGEMTEIGDDRIVGGNNLREIHYRSTEKRKCTGILV